MRRRLGDARIPYTWAEILHLVLLLVATVIYLVGLHGCVRLFMGGAVPHTGETFQAPRDGG